jgi:[FeFe] hydrogenase (group B1/B3)
MKAIRSDEYGRAEIDQEKCVSCGMCLANCPFGAIADKAQIFQCIQALRSDTPVYAAIAPAIAGQFGKDLTPDKMRAAFKALEFGDIVEVSIGADLCTLQEARDFLTEVPEKLPFMGTSCCPAWSVMAKREFPKQAECISMALTPMVLAGRFLKKIHPGCKVAFIGPCAAKKLEASRRSIRSDVDFVLTFEEVQGMFEAKEVDFNSLPAEEVPSEGSADGRGFCVSGGVANAVVNCIKKMDPDREVLVERAEGLNDCRKMMLRAKAGKLNGYLLEGMACPGGCVGGAGTVQLIPKAVQEVEKIKKASNKAHAYESDYSYILTELEE